MAGQASAGQSADGAVNPKLHFHSLTVMAEGDSMGKRMLLACGGLWLAVFLIGAGIGLGAEPGEWSAAAGSQEPGANGPEAAFVQVTDRGGDGYADVTGTRPGSSAASDLSRTGGVSYQYDALGRITEIVRVPGK